MDDLARPGTEQIIVQADDRLATLQSIVDVDAAAEREAHRLVTMSLRHRLEQMQTSGRIGCEKLLQLPDHGRRADVAAEEPQSLARAGRPLGTQRNELVRECRPGGR